MDFGLVPYGIPDPQSVERWAEDGKGRMTISKQASA
jgi:hypothetical protein